MKLRGTTLVTLVSTVLLSGCSGGTNAICDAHFDFDYDGLCENCGKPVEKVVCNHIDSNSDGYCDLCSLYIGLPIDPSLFTRVKAAGSMVKKHYGYNDSWDPTGIIVSGVTATGKEIVLSPSDYNVTFNPTKPSLFVSRLTVDVSLKLKPELQGSVFLDDLSVDVAPWDFGSEVSNYYKDANLNLSSSSLMSELQRHSFAKHTHFTEYGDIKDYKMKTNSHESTDLVPNESKMELFFTGLKTNYGSGNREHIWPSANSRGLWIGEDLTNSYIGGGSDLYHVRPTTEEINTAHGNGLYVDFDDFSYRNIVSLGDGGPYKVKYYGLNSQHEFCNYLEVDDHMKGDLARIIAYVYMHYGRNGGVPTNKTIMAGSLRLSDVLGYNETTCKNKLIEWNELDPVSEVEKYRNHTVELIQGNRNPFVDHPELIRKAFK